MSFSYRKLCIRIGRQRQGSIILTLAAVLLCVYWTVEAQEKNRHIAAKAYITHEGHSLQVKRAGSSVWVELPPPYHLYAGDSLKNGQDRPLLYLRSNTAEQNRFLLEPGAIHAFHQDTIAAQPPGQFQRLIEVFWKFFAGGPDVGKAGAPRGSAGLDEPYLLYPYWTVFQTQPQFYWTRVKDCDQYRIMVYAVDRGKTVLSVTATDTTLEFPKMIPPLEAGERYRVSIVPINKPEKVFNFRVADTGIIQAYERKISDLRDEFPQNGPASEQQRLESEIIYLIGMNLPSEAWLRASRALPEFPDNEIFRKTVPFYENEIGIPGIE